MSCDQKIYLKLIKLYFRLKYFSNKMVKSREALNTLVAVFYIMQLTALIHGKNIKQYAFNSKYLTTLSPLITFYVLKQI